MPDLWWRGKQAAEAPEQQAVGELEPLSSGRQRQPVCTNLVLPVGSWLVVHQNIHMLCGGHAEHILIGMQLMLGTWPANRTAESALLGLPLWQTTSPQSGGMDGSTVRQPTDGEGGLRRRLTAMALHIGGAT